MSTLGNLQLAIAFIGIFVAMPFLVSGLIAFLRCQKLRLADAPKGLAARWNIATYQPEARVKVARAKNYIFAGMCGTVGGLAIGAQHF